MRVMMGEKKFDELFSRFSKRAAIFSEVPSSVAREPVIFDR